MQPIFSHNFLTGYIADFRLSSVPGIRNTTELIKEFLSEMASGKIPSMKEEEIKSRFINLFFGDILGFNYGNYSEWRLREEKKTSVDGTKSDAALGYFFIDKEKDMVRAVIELKNSGTDLDAKQKRTNQQSPVEQAFSYAPKMGGQSKWVIVSNIDEIRFYSADDMTRYQRFYFKELTEENTLKELLFLFHKDRFIKKQGQSATDRLLERSKLSVNATQSRAHIIDQLYTSLKRFEGFGFVDPNYLANLRPFNILEDHVQHYHNQNLLTNNPDIYELLNNLSVTDNKVTFTTEFEIQLKKAGVLEAKEKAEWIFRFLNQSMINSVSAVKDYRSIEKRNKNTIGFSSRAHFSFSEAEGVTKDIYVFHNYTCKCVSCQYRTFDFNGLLKRINEAAGSDNANTAEIGFGNYLVASDSYKTTYTIFRRIAQRDKAVEGKEISYFLARQNSKNLYNLIAMYGLADRQQMMEESKSVDLDKVIYDEIEFSVDEEVKRYLIKVKENDLVYKAQDEIEYICDKIWKLDQLYKNDGEQTAGPDLPRMLIHWYLMLYFHINTNFIIYDIFSRYRSLSLKVFRALVTSHFTPAFRLEKFDDFLLTEAIIHIDSSEIKKVLNGIEELKVSSKTSGLMLDKLQKFLTSYYKDSLFGKSYKNELLQSQLINYPFRSKFRNIFSNMFSIFRVIEINSGDFQRIKMPLMKFLEIEEELAWTDLKELGYFVDRKGGLFDAGEMERMLEISINRAVYGSHKYRDLAELVCYAIKFYHPEHKIFNTKLIQQAIMNCSSNEGHNLQCDDLVSFIDITEGQNQSLLKTAFEKQLDEKFSPDLYQELLWNGALNFAGKNYLQQYSEYVNLHKGGRAFTYGKLKLTDLVFINYIAAIYKRQIDFNSPELKLITNTTSFESWLLNPEAFDYTNFQAKWLVDVDRDYMLARLRNIPAIKEALEEELKTNFDPVLAKLKYGYFI